MVLRTAKKLSWSDISVKSMVGDGQARGTVEFGVDFAI